MIKVVLQLDDYLLAYESFNVKDEVVIKIPFPIEESYS